jgi:23S rRNA (cytosine1962-C5)-methyltransferase
MNAPAAEKFRDPALVDFGADAGGGRRLEMLGGILVDRPLRLPGLPRRRLPRWEGAAVYADAPDGKGRWTFTAPLPDPWRVAVNLRTATISLEVRPAPSGQVGVFLEQVPQWRWLADVTPPGARMLSLFAHSGAATLALAAAGAEVVHVDASKQATAMARRNADASGLAAAPIRWLCDDVPTFVARELRRGGRYDGVVLDPPSWGHGPAGRGFAIDRDLAPLLADLGRLLDAGASAGPLLLTSHSPGWHPRRLQETLSEALRPSRRSAERVESGTLACTDAAGRTLELGAYARWPAADRRTPPPP